MKKYMYINVIQKKMGNRQMDARLPKIIGVSAVYIINMLNRIKPKTLQIIR